VSSRRILILILAVALAGVAAFATYTYLSSADERANQGSALVNVLVLKHDVAKGTKGVEAIKNADIGSEQVPERLAPPSAITDVNSINQLVAITDFKAGALLQQGMFVDPTVAQTSFADRLEAEKGKHAISISVDQVHGVGGFITPGDYVNLIVEVQPTSLGQTAAPADAAQPADANGANGEDKADESTVYLLQKVKVLAVGTSVIPQAGEDTTATNAAVTQNTGLITFAVTPEEALKIARAQDAGTIYLSLVPDDYQVTPIVPINATNVLDAQYVYF
jgi:Flp pilus assembly protein CpaB